HTSAARGFDRLIAQLDEAKPAAHENGRRPDASRSARLAAAAALATAAAAAFVMFGGPAFFAEREPARYETLADAPDAVAPGGVQIDLVFAAELSEAERERLLEEIGAEIVSGPSSIGR